MTFDLKEIRGFIVAQSQIHHGGDSKTGNETLFRTQEYYISKKKMFIPIPIIHGNAFRGLWRRLIMADLAEMLDIGYKDGKTFRLKKDAYHSLFSGGMFKTIEKKNAGKVLIDFKKKVHELLPPLSLLGTAYGTQNITSKLSTSHLLPLCSELKDEYLPNDIPEEFQSRLSLSVYEFKDFMFQTRRDDLREEREEGEQAVQMLIRYEVLKPGTVLYMKLGVKDSTEIELSCLARIFELWKQNPILGGRSAIGLGEVDPHLNIEISSKQYLDFVEDRKEDVIEFLESL